MVHRKAMFKPDLDPVLRHRLQTIKASMMQRCYDVNAPKYKNYGARGVTVDNKWHKFKGFLDDYDKIDGWDEAKFLNHELQLDKDIKFLGNKLYSRDTCMWVSPEENIKVKPSYQKAIIGVRIDGYTEEFTNTNEFAKKYPEIVRTGVQRVATGKAKYHNGWYFYYRGETPNPPVVYKAVKGEETKLSFWQSKLEKEIDPNCSTGVIHKMLKNIRNNEIKGWTISWYVLPC